MLTARVALSGDRVVADLEIKVATAARRSAGPRIAPGRRSRPRGSPGGGAGGAGLHDEGDAVPEAADVCAADLVSTAEMVVHEAPVRVELLEERAPARGVEEGRGSGRLDAR